MNSGVHFLAICACNPKSPSGTNAGFTFLWKSPEGLHGDAPEEDVDNFWIGCLLPVVVTNLTNCNYRTKSWGKA